MRLLVTGAAGFIGRSTVATALRRGHEVRALVRPATDVAALPWSEHPQVEIARGDLRTREGLEAVVGGCDVVVHLAAAMTGDFQARLESTVSGTENLLRAMAAAGVRRIVGVSSIAVYDYAGARAFEPLDELSPLEPHPERRDDYCRSKILQEQQIRDLAGSSGIAWLILRPGVVFGRGRLWTHRLGVAVTPRLWVLAGTRAPLPLTFVEHCAEAIVLAAERDDVNGIVLNIVDDETPGQLDYARRIRGHLQPGPLLIPMSALLVRWLSAAAAGLYRLLGRGRRRPGGLLAPSQLAMRCRPRRYANRRLRETLGWEPRWSLDEALDRIRAGAQEEAASAGDA